MGLGERAFAWREWERRCGAYRPRAGRGEQGQQAGQRFFEHVAAAEIHAAALADGVGHVDLARSGGGVELAHEKRLVGGLGKEHLQRVQMPARHGEDQVRARDEFVGERLAAQAGNVDALVRQGLDGVVARRLAGRGVHARGRHAHVPAVRDHLPEKPFGHGAAADVAGADEKDVFHGGRPAAAVRSLGANGKSTRASRAKDNAAGLTVAGTEDSAA